MACANKPRHWWAPPADPAARSLKSAASGKGGARCWAVGIGFTVLDFNAGPVSGHMRSEHSVKSVNVQVRSRST